MKNKRVLNRNQLEKNPLSQVKPPKAEKKNVVIYTQKEFQRIMKAAKDMTNTDVNWELIILLAATTGMRKSEILNLTWRNINFDDMTIDVSSKEDTAGTWKWFVKDSEERTLPITEEVSKMLIEHQERQPVNYPYVFIPPYRYEHIQELRKQGNWTLIDARKKVIANFRTRFLTILKRANVKPKKFHDLRSTALSVWIRQGIQNYEVQRLAGHSKFETTNRYYIAVSGDLLDRARQASGKNLSHIWRAPPSEVKKERSQHA